MATAKFLLLNPISLSTLNGKPRWWVGAGSRWAFSMDRPGGSYGSYAPAPRDLMFLTTWLRNRGFDDTQLMDACAMQYYRYDKFFEDIDLINPSHIIIDITTPQADLVLGVAKKLSEKYKIIFVGPFCSVMKDYQEEVPWAFIIEGGYEDGMRQYLSGADSPVCGKMISNTDFQDLTPAYDNALDRGPYRSPFLWREPCLKHNYSEKQLWMFSSKGCYMDCAFCLWTETTYGNKIVFKEAGKFISQTEKSIKKYNPEYLLFDDDNFNCHPAENAKEIVRWLKKTGLPWSVMVSFDDKRGYDESMYKLYEKCGCVGIRVGIESMDQASLDLICPKKNVEQQTRIMNYITNHTSLPLHVSIQHDMLGETPAGRIANDEMYAKLKPLYHSTGGRVNVQYPLSMAFPGTRQARMLEEKGLWFKGNPMKIEWHKVLDGSTSNNEIVEISKWYNRLLMEENNQ